MQDIQRAIRGFSPLTCGSSGLDVVGDALGLAAPIALGRLPLPAYSSRAALVKLEWAAEPGPSSLYSPALQARHFRAACK